MRMEWFTLIYILMANRLLASDLTREVVSSNEILELVPDFKCVPSLEYDTVQFYGKGESYLFVENKNSDILISEYCIDKAYQSYSHKTAKPLALIYGSKLEKNQFTLPTRCNTTNCYRKYCPMGLTFNLDVDPPCVFSKFVVDRFQDNEQAIIKETILSSFTSSDTENIEIVYGNSCPICTENNLFRVNKSNIVLTAVIQSQNISLGGNKSYFDLDSQHIQRIILVTSLDFKVSIPKCCLAGQVLNSNGNCTLPSIQIRNRNTSLHIPYVALSTDTYFLLNSTYIEEFPNRDIQCNGNDLVTIVGYANSYSSKNLEVFLDSRLFITNSPVIMKDQFNFDEYCIDELENNTNFTEQQQELQNYPLMAKVCNPCASKPCINRCCAEGYFINSTTSLCQKFENLNKLSEMPIRFLDSNGYYSYTTDYLAIPLSIANVISCRNYKRGISLVQNRNDFYVMKDSGLLGAPHHIYNNELVLNYCIEYFIKDGREPTIKAYFCSPKQSQQNLLWIKVSPLYCLTSASFLAATFLVYILLEKLRKQQGSMNTMSLVGSMSVMYFGFGFMMLQLDHLSANDCVIIASLTHYFFLATFTWMTIISLDLLNLFRHVQTKQERDKKQRRQFVYYSALGWGIPLFLEGVTQIIRWYPEEDLPLWVIKPRFGQVKCLFSGEAELTIYYIIPMGIMVSFNTINFIRAAVCYYKISTAASVSMKYVRKRLLTFFRIFVLVGLPWIIQIVAFVCCGPNWSIMTDVWIMVHGILMFVTLVYKPNVLKMLREKSQRVIHLLRNVLFSVSQHVAKGEKYKYKREII